MKNILLFLCFFILIFACKKSNSSPIPTPPKTDQITGNAYNWDKFSMGADLSYVNQIEDNGGVYRDSGAVKDVFKIFKNHGCNTVRVRLWHNPTWYKALNSGKIYSDLADVERTIKRAKAEGMAVNLDLHYSDDWADPNKQLTPDAWKNLKIDALKDSVYNYTFAILTYLKSKNLTPEMIQIGNEINFGLLHPIGKIENNNFVNCGILLNSGIKAVREFSKNSSIKPQIILQVAQLQDAEWWVKGIKTSGAVHDFDIIGLSHYNKWTTVKSLEAIGKIINTLRNTYTYKVMIVETAFPWTDKNADTYNNLISNNENATNYALTQAEQKRYLQDLTQTVISAGGSGVQYWEPAWITSSMKDRWGTGSSWENCALFDFSGNTIPSIDYMKPTYKF